MRPGGAPKGSGDDRKAWGQRRARSGSGWEHTHWIAPVATPLAGVLKPGALPRGFDTLQVPPASVVARAVAELQPSSDPVSEQRQRSERPAVVVDIETSGLGATIVPFIAAVAWHQGDQVRLEQWTLHDPAAEREFLGAVFGRLDELVVPGVRLLSYNGASFDLPRLRTRAARLHLGADALSGGHLDLVIVARRVRKASLPNCRLSTLESEMLGMRRRGDMGGAEIAELWSRMCLVPGFMSDDVDAGAVDPFLLEDLAAAQVHNRGDVLGLFTVATGIASRLARPRGLAEAIGAARHHRHCAQLEQAVAVLRPLVEIRPRAARATRATLQAWVDGALLLADLHRVAGQHDQASVLWRTVCEVAPGNIRAHEALAKHLEHRERSPRAALDVALASAAPCSKRIARLQRKADLATPARE